MAVPEKRASEKSSPLMAGKSGGAACPTCKVEIPRRKPEEIVHCRGSRHTRVFSSNMMERHGRLHHGRRQWKCPNPECGAVLGCDHCCGKIPNAVLCTRCETYADGDVIGPGRQPFRVNLFPVQQILTGIDKSLPTSDR
jgi:hypothetical protein